MTHNLDRQGFVLIEVVASLGLAGVIVAMLAVSVQLLFRMSGEQRRQVQVQRTLDRCDLQVRDDIHRAERLVGPTDKDGDGIRAGIELVDMIGVRTEYRADEHRLIRTVTEDAGRVRRDVYILPRGTRFRWQVGGRRQGRILVSLLIDVPRKYSPSVVRADRVTRDVGRTTSIRAALALHHSLNVGQEH